MSVTDRNLIDAISSDSIGRIVLTISDHLDWDDNNNHLIILQDKINDYLEILTSGQIYEIYPNSIDKKLMIQVVFEHSPNKLGREFLDRVEDILKKNNLEFNYYEL